MAVDPPQWGSKPTGTQQENDLAMMGQTVFNKEYDGSYPTPVISTIAPTSGTSPVSLTVNGTGFVAQSIVTADGTNRTTTFVSATRLTTSVVGTAGQHPIQVKNGAKVSNSVQLTIT